MRIQLILFICSIVLNPALWGQAASLPTSFDFNNANPPVGWTLSLQAGNATYASGCDGNPSCRMDETGDKVDIAFAESPGDLTYCIKGSTWQGAAWEGTFNVQESVNGTAWTDMRVFTAASSPGVSGFTNFTDTPAASSRYIRFFYTSKISGSNIALDQINLAIPGATPAQEINVTYNNAKVITGSNIAVNAAVNDSTDFTFMIGNLGNVSTLQISGISLSGPQSSEYQILAPQPDSVPALDSLPLMLRFKPLASGTRAAVLTIDNNDADENPFIINLFGVGGNFASEPIAAPSNFTASDVRSFMMNISFTEPNPAPDGGYLVLRKRGSAITDAPADGSTYQRGDMIGTSKVVYSDLKSNFSPNDIQAALDYHFAIFAYNGANQFINYLESQPLTGMVTSAALSMRDPNYYNGVNPNFASFIPDLTNLIQPHFQVFYANYLSTMIPFSSRDTTGFNKVISCEYSGQQKVYAEPFNFNTYNFSREHTFSYSWMPNLVNQDSMPYSDQHNLMPTNLDDVNIPRSNNPFGNVVNVSTQYLQGKSGTDANGNTVYEPRDSRKGDVARAIFYMTTAYQGWYGTNWSWNSLTGKKIQDQDQQLLKDWHFQDPPDAWEIARNDFLDTLQMNRNPFVDHPEYVCFIDFQTMTRIVDTAGPCTPTGVDAPQEAMLQVFPNPNQGQFAVEFLSHTSGVVNIGLVNLLGTSVYKEDILSETGQNRVQISAPELSAGIYLLQISIAGQQYSRKILID